MSRDPRTLKPSYCYHLTTRCNNRDFRLVREECRDVLLYAIHKCQVKYDFKLYALCLMSNHVHCPASGLAQDYALAELVHGHVL